MYVLDSSIIIEIIENGPRAQKAFDALQNEPLVTTSITMHEVLSGALDEKKNFIIEGVFSTMRVLSHDVLSSKRSARIERELTRSGSKINFADVLIAGICQEHNAEIVTFDKDFARIKGFKARIL